MDETVTTLPPTDIIDTPVPKGRIFKEDAICGSAVLCGPIGSIYMLAANFNRFGERDKAALTWIFGILYTILLLIGVIFLRSLLHFPSSIYYYAFFYVIGGINAVLAYYIFHYQQEDKVNTHISQKGGNYRMGRVTVVSLAGALVSVVPAIYAFLLVQPVMHFDTLKTYNVDTAPVTIGYNSTNMTEEDADEINDAALATGYYNAGMPHTLYVYQGPALYKITIVCTDVIERDPSYILYLTGWRERMEDNIGGHKIVVVVCLNSVGNVYRVIE